MILANADTVDQSGIDSAVRQIHNPVSLAIKLTSASNRTCLINGADTAAIVADIAVIAAIALVADVVLASPVIAAVTPSAIALVTNVVFAAITLPPIITIIAFAPIALPAVIAVIASAAIAPLLRVGRRVFDCVCFARRFCLCRRHDKNHRSHYKH